MVAAASCEDTVTPRTETTLAETAASSDGGSSERAFPLPEGWRVVCRLSAGDVRSRWGARPRPAPAGAAGAAVAGTAFEADLVMPEASQPLRLPLQLLAKWAEPCVGAEFAGRYEVQGDLPERPFWRGCRSKYFEVYDRCENAQRALQVCDLVGEVDVKFFVERLQLEALDSDSRFFLRLRDVAFALPRHLAVIEDIPRRSLWEEFRKLESNTNMGAKVREIANAILAGLCRLHSCGWAHCSISPDTICLALDGAWKLTGLESARKVQELAAAGPPSAPGVAPSPEALLGLPAGEKMDVWHLGAALSEALMQQRIGGGDLRKPSEQLCALVDFLGPLPSGLVEKHPRREEHFTPEGHMLRPTTPDNAGSQSLEAIEPAQVMGEQDAPRPRLVVRALQGVDGADQILDFLGQLLAADPEQRPSAKQALAHPLLQAAEQRHAKFSVAGDGEEAGSKIQRKGTGFVHLGELPDSDEDEDEEEEERERPEHVRIQDGHGDNENTLKRKGTGYVRLDELPNSEDEDEDEDEQEARPGHVHIEMAEDHKSNTLVRKGTGFVNVGELPDSDEEDEDEEEDERPQGAGQEKHARIEAGDGDHEGHLQRKGTGFVRLGELPPSDDEDEDEEEEAPQPKHARVEAGEGDHEHHLQRKGTGFVRLGDLPPSDDEDEEDEEEDSRSAPKAVRIAQEAQEQQEEAPQARQMARKGTGFVRLDELPMSDDDDESEEESKPPPKAKKGVRMQEEDDDAPQETMQIGKGKPKVKAKVQMQDDDEPQETMQIGKGKPKVKAKVQMQEDDEPQETMQIGRGKPKVKTKVKMQDDEDEPQETMQIGKGKPKVKAKVQMQGEDDEPRETVQIGKGKPKANAKVRIEDQGEQGGRGQRAQQMARKGTGFVSMKDAGVDFDLDSDEGTDCEEKTPADKLARKGTGFVSLGDLPDSEDEDEDEDEEESAGVANNRKVRIAHEHQDKAADEPSARKAKRAGTQFVSTADLDLSSDED